MRAMYIQKVLPAVYDDSISYYELLAKIQEKCNELVDSNNAQNVAIATINQIVEDFTNGGYLDSFDEFAQEWIEDNLNTYVAEIIEEIADGTVMNMVADGYVPFPLPPLSKYGTDGQLLATDGTGETEWVDPVIVTSEVAAPLIESWLDQHPEAVTTVQDNSLENSKLTRWAFTRLSSLRVITTNASPYVLFDTSQLTMVLPKDCIIVGPQYYYVIPETIIIDLSTSTSTAKVVGFNPETHEFQVSNYNTSLGRNFQLLCAIRSGGAHLRIDAAFPYSVDGLPYGVSVSDTMLPDGVISNPKLDSSTGLLPSFRSIDGKLILGKGRYVDYDTVNQTITFPADTLLCTVSKQGTPQYAYVNLSPNNTPRVIENVNVATLGSSAVKCYYDRSNDTFIFMRYTQVISSPNCIFLFTLRISGGAFAGAFDASFPWSIDGKPYGMDSLPDSGFNWNLLDDSHVKGVNHRGFSHVGPENTIPAFKLSYQHKFKYVETDIAFTSDKVPVLLHDATINRTARNDDGTEIADTINISSITYQEALQYDFGIWKGTEYAGTRIPTLKEFLVFCRNTNMTPYLEIKGVSLSVNEVVTIITNTVKECGMAGKCTYISFGIGYLLAVQQLDPMARFGYLLNTVTSEGITQANRLLDVPESEVFINSGSTTSAEVELCKAAGLQLERWVVDDASVMASIDPYVSGISSNTLNTPIVLAEAAMS